MTTDLTTDQKHPVILHHSDYLTKLISKQAHIDHLHVGPTALLGIVSLNLTCKGDIKSMCQLQESLFKDSHSPNQLGRSFFSIPPHWC